MRFRKLILPLSLVLLLLVGTAAAAILPRLPALKCLLHFNSELPEDPDRDGPAPAGYERLTDEAAYGVKRAWLRAHDTGDKRQPCLVFVHGVSPLGIEDGRILRAVEAFHRGGFCIVAPEIGFMTDPTVRDNDEARLVKLLQAIADGKIAQADPNRIGIVGISVGSGFALKAAARWLRAGKQDLAAILCIGAADDIKGPTKDWYALPNPDPEGGSSFEWERNNAAAFARNYGARAGLVRRFGDTKDAEAIATWLKEEDVPTVETRPELETQAANAFADMLLAGPTEWTAAREGLLADAWDQLVQFSPAAWDSELDALRGVPIFLLHGEGDPLIPVSEVEPLRKRLEARTLVSVLRSHMVGHTTVNKVGIGEKLDLIAFMDSFLDIVKR